MKKGNLLKYILIGVLAAAAFLVGFAFIHSLINKDKTFADGFKSWIDWLLAVVFGTSCAFSSWKKDNEGEKK
jgi:hypothetical protein